MSAPLIDSDDARFRLGVAEMNTVHSEFIALVNAIAEADGAELLDLFEQLIEHTQAHFYLEEHQMAESRFPALPEHRSDHRRVLADLLAIGNRSPGAELAMGRAYVREQLPGWFAVHAATMDSALAVHLKASSGS